MTHRYAVVDGYCIELCGKASEFLDLGLYNLADLVQMGMSRNELCERIDYRYYRFADLLLFHAVGAPESAGSGHAAALGAGGAS